ncbi:MAG: hypothetical protein AAB036_11080 [Elusimicrobiota bacterium]
MNWGLRLVVLAALLAGLTPAGGAKPGAVSATLAALERQAARDPGSAQSLEKASFQAGEGFDSSSPEPSVPPASNTPSTGRGRSQYYFEGKSPIDGITIYTPKKDETGNGSTEVTSSGYGRYGKYAMAAGVAIGIVAVLAPAPFLAPLVAAAGTVFVAGALLAFFS